MLSIGTPAPTFTLTDQAQRPVRLSDGRGQWVLLYFYPKADTPGCTTEACALAELFENFHAHGVMILGVSQDTPADNKAFAEKYHLPFRLLSDETTAVIQAYEAGQERTTANQTVIEIQRVSYLIDPTAVVAKVYDQVDPATHASEVLRDLRVLTRS